MLATWLLPIVPLVVVSTTGGIVAQTLETVDPFWSLLTVIISTVALTIGLTLSFMVITVYMIRLVIYKLPPKGFIVSKFLPLGPLGQVSYPSSPDLAP
jgi:tellurite resistance protein TehA-like permease